MPIDGDLTFRELARRIVWMVGARRQKGWIGPGYQPICGLAIISQKIASTAPKAGNPNPNHHQNSLW